MRQHGEGTRLGGNAALGEAFDDTKNDDFYYLPQEAFDNADFKPTSSRLQADFKPTSSAQ
jgi:uncharacterized membrane protein YdfJ with MMPL/SSD domain